MGQRVLLGRGKKSKRKWKGVLLGRRPSGVFLGRVGRKRKKKQREMGQPF